jgi:methylmalonyl-CoA/ethylmalonyl-CoA epimerase
MHETMPATAPAFHLDTIGQIALNVARSKEFYRNTLGMNLLFDAGQMAFFQCGSVRLMLGAPEPGQAPPTLPATTVVYFTVHDIQAARTALLAQDVEFSHPPHLVAKMPNHELWMAFQKDPDGNTLALYERSGRELRRDYPPSTQPRPKSSLDNLFSLSVDASSC